MSFPYKVTLILGLTPLEDAERRVCWTQLPNGLQLWGMGGRCLLVFVVEVGG